MLGAEEIQHFPMQGVPPQASFEQSKSQTVQASGKTLHLLWLEPSAGIGFMSIVPSSKEPLHEVAQGHLEKKVLRPPRK